MGEPGHVHVGNVTLSAGVCSTETARDAERLIPDADRALYWAKDGGRNVTFLSTATSRAPPSPTGGRRSNDGHSQRRDSRR